MLIFTALNGWELSRHMMADNSFLAIIDAIFAAVGVWLILSSF
jgi:hypothetical protein